MSDHNKSPNSWNLKNYPIIFIFMFSFTYFLISNHITFFRKFLIAEQNFHVTFTLVSTVGKFDTDNVLYVEVQLFLTCINLIFPVNSNYLYFFVTSHPASVFDLNNFS